MKTTVDIADPLLEEAKRVAKESGCTLRELIELGLRHELDRRQRPAPFKLRDASVMGMGLHPGVRSDARAMKAYVRLMGQPGYPDTVEGISGMLDEEG